MTDEKKKDDLDPRIEFISNYAAKSLRLKTDKWPKMMSNDEFSGILNDFLTNPNENILILNLSPAGLLIPYLGYPSDVRTKSVHFTKRHEEAVTEENYRSLLIFGDVSPNPVEALSVLLEGIFVPILSNSGNRTGWPRCVSDDVLKRIHTFRATVQEIRGKVLGQTLLPMPVGVERVESEAERVTESNGMNVDLHLKSSIEGVVIKWAYLIEEVIRDDSIKCSTGEHPGPLAEIEFWNKRLNNLENLFEQLVEPRVRNMARILQLTDSMYYNPYETLFGKVLTGVTEARNVVAYLQPFASMIGRLESTEFLEIEEQLEPILHCVCLMWSRSNYYSLTHRILGFLQKLSNSVATQCMKFLDPSSVFQGDPEENRLRVQQCLDILTKFRELGQEYRMKVKDYFVDKEPIPWNFHMKTAFSRVYSLIGRLEILRAFLDTVLDYLKLDRIVFGGIKGWTLGLKVTAILEDFQASWSTFSASTYDPLDPDINQFLVDYEKFKSTSLDFDRRLAAIFVQAFDECYDLDSLFKLMIMLGTLTERPIIRAEINKKYILISQLMEQNLDSIKEIYDIRLIDFDVNGRLSVPMYLPPTVGIVSWITTLRSRITRPFDYVKLLGSHWANSNEMTRVLEKQENMLSLLQGLLNEVITDFQTKAPLEAELHLMKPLLNRCTDNTLVLNFDPGLVTILKEIKYLNLLGPFDLPTLLTDLYARDDTLFIWVQCLNQLVTCYNEIRQKSKPVEFVLVSDEVDFIDTLVNNGIRFLNWTSPESETFISKTRKLVKQLYARVSEAQQNTQQIHELIFQWRQQPLYVRNGPKALLGLNDKFNKVAARYNAIKLVGEEIHELVRLNYHLLLNIPLPESSGDEGEYDENEEEGEEWSEEEGNVEEETEADSNKTDKKQRRRRKRTREEDILEMNLRSTDVQEATGSTPLSLPMAETLDVVPPGNLVVSTPKKKMKKTKVKAMKKKKTKEKGDGKTKKAAEALIPEKAEVPTFPGAKGDFQGADPQKQKWSDYVDYIDQVVVAGILSTVSASVGYILNETNQTFSRPPLFEVTLELREPDLCFSPALNDAEGSSGLLGIINGILTDIYGIGHLVNRVAEHKNVTNYQIEAEGCKDLLAMREEVIQRTKKTIKDVNVFKESLMQYSYIWMDNQQEALQAYLRYGRVLTQEEDELAAMGILTIPEKKPTMTDFKEIIDFYQDLYMELDSKIDSQKTFQSWLLLNCKPFKHGLLNGVRKWGFLFKNHLCNHVLTSIFELETFIYDSDAILSVPVEEGDYDALVGVMAVLFNIRSRTDNTDEMFEPLWDTIELLKNCDVELNEETHIALQELPEKWSNLKKQAVAVRQMIQPLIVTQVSLVRKRMALFDVRQSNYRDHFRSLPLFSHRCVDVYQVLDKTNHGLIELEESQAEIAKQAALFEVPVTEVKHLVTTRKELRTVKNVWDLVNIIDSWFQEWKKSPWKKIDVEGMDQECKRFSKELRGLDKETRSWDVYIHTEALLKNMMTSLRAVTELQNPAIRERHWKQLMQATKVKFVMHDSTTLADLLVLNLHEYEEEVKTIVDKSVKEMSMEKTLRELEQTWKDMEFDKVLHGRTNTTVIAANEELVETLENDQNQLQNMMSSKFIDYFLTEVSRWQRKLSNADQVISIWMEVQRSWQHLESIFIGSEDIRSQLPTDTKRFEQIDSQFRVLLAEMVKDLNVVRSTDKPGLYAKLEGLQEQLVLCEKALADYLETKRLIYPRFYFVSSADLLDILSNGNQPELVARHLTKLYDSLGRLNFSGGSKIARGMFAKDGEYVEFKSPCDCSGKVEAWLNRVTDTMRKSLRLYFAAAVQAYDEKPRDQFLLDFPAQVALCATQIWWSTEVTMAFERLGEGYENALKDYNKKQVQQLSVLISMLLGDLTKGDRQKIMTVCTIDVHSRDVIAKMVQQKVDSASAFQWQSQLRHRWDVKARDCFANICDAQFRYDYEYLGCTPRLVITPLTDRCYITLTQSLRLIMGGAPAGPAGTGKTETTKDLGRALGCMVYVFNCSEQMDYKSCGNIYKGLAQTGAWGCFDEFNRISVEVLSVVAVQVKSVQDAIKAKRQWFNFMGETINLVPTVGIFITMNPGYAGRTELPENLKALFRPCAMVVPDFELICEIMLVAEGFQEARLLARKFITLYTLCRELLSKQDHYDWGLRAIKSVLVVAGSLKRGDRQRAEDQVLMRALRDFNIPKIITDDLPVFLGLIGDLFPALDVPRKRDLNLEKDIRGACIELKLQPEDNFILKCVQLEELFEVRHSVFIVGFAGTGKTQVWKTLMKTYTNQKRKPWYNDLNPKAVTNDELFGAINPATREWRDGLFSVIMRDQANMTGDGPKWIVLDGDIDPMWIESLNTLMDDNKVLTLASNERIALTPPMRLLFEISNLRTATPATVSRAGILYINAADLGWNPFVTSWIDTRKNESEKVQLIILFDKYVQPCLDVLKTKLKKITPLPEINHVQILCQLLNCLLTPSNVPEDCPKEWYEIYFVFACVWAFGAAMFQDQLIDWRNEFSKWFVSEFKVVKFPSGGNVFSYYIDPETKQFLPWTEVVPPYEFDPDIPLQNTLVSTAETTRIRYLMDLLMEIRVPVMLVGGAGSGKSVIVSDKVSSLPETYAVTNVPFNFYTTSEMLQKILEKPLEKKAGRNYGPPGNKNMIYFIDDMNMPEVDTYGTVQPHTLIRQHIDYSHWYDRTKFTLKEVHNCQYVSCMNPTAGSFSIDPRLQRHFAVFAVSLPSGEALQSIYEKILMGHLTLPGSRFNPALPRMVPSLVNVALQMQQKMGQAFLPTAVKFHYTFNMRDLTNIFQGMLFSTPECIPTPGSLIKLWMHESYRVYADKLVEEKDMKSFRGYINELVQKGFEELNENEVFVDPLLFCHFAEGIGENRYLPISNWNVMSHLLEEALAQYNELVAAANLVLFEDAMHHICRINRILEAPRGNALLVGVGGSGKQSLSRLAAFISSLEVFQIQLRKGYSLLDLKADLAQQYLKAGLKNIGVVFLMTDAQVAEEKFLVLINDCLASGEIPELFPDDEIDNIINAVRNEVKGAGIVDTKENCWKFFIGKVRRLLKIVLCFSPVGSTLRVRARKFPAIVNCSAIDWFHEWPHEALVSVSHRFLSQIPSLPEELRDPVSRFMAHVHTSVNVSSETFLAAERRYNYTTPKSFLEQIALYGKLLENKTNANQNRIGRLENGLTKLVSTAAQVDGLKVTLAEQEVVLAEKNAAADALIGVVSAESEKVAKEKAIAAEEEEKVRAIEEDVTIKQRLCEDDLVKAIPSLEAAQAALDTLDKGNLTEYKSLGTPPPGADDVAAAVMVLFAAKGKIPRMQDRTWKNSKVMMGKVDTFLDQLKNYDKENMQPEAVKAVQYYLDKPGFDPEKIKTKSSAAAGLCSWVINIIKFYEVFRDVEPKRIALNKANEELEDARNRLNFLKKKLAELEEKLGELTAEYDVAMEAKMKCQAEADNTALTINLANRLVNGLASESVRWKESVANLKVVLSTLPGDVLLTTAFVSYLGSFTKRYRVELVEKQWQPFIKSVQPPIPMTDGADHLSLLTDDAQIAEWNNQGLPGDRMSVENATILVNSSRWPLMIDPQLQGIKWIKNKYGDTLRTIRLGQKSYLEIIESAISNGETILIEYIGETVDAVLDPLLSRALIRKGRAIKIGDKEVDFNPSFRLILQTKLANPHYQPEMQAQTTLINFTVTKDGLEEQLLGEVVKAERPDLEELKTELTQQQNSFKIALKGLEEELLTRLNMAGDDILSDVALVNNLETTKSTAAEVTQKVAEAKITAIKIDEAREQYRPVAARASLLYFVLNDLNKMNAIYQFSLKAFSTVFNKAITGTAEAETLKERVVLLLENVTYCVFMYTSRALFESDKLTFTAHMAIQILLAAKEIEPEELDFLLRYPANPNAPSPLDFLSNLSWGGIKTLSLMLEFRNLDKDMEASAKRWKKLVESEKPEREKLPQEWKNKTALQRLCIMRCLRPDRMTYAIVAFIEEKLGVKYAESRTVPLSQSFEESTPSAAVFFILSPGVDPSKDVEQLGRQLGFTQDKRTFHNISLGQGQEVVAEEAMDMASQQGHWVMLQNVHLVKNWLPVLEKKMEQCADGANENYRLFISAEPAPTPELNIIPQGIVESAIKITNEPPTGMLANIHKALDNFNQATLESCSKEAEFKSILFALCYFHAVVAERRKFGSQGWNRVYPFNNGDLRISVSVLFNYLENNNKVPWEDLRYLFGEIMYGGHITDDWDRRLCRTYLEEFMRPDLLDGELFLAPGFQSPPNLDYVAYHRYIDHYMPAESPSLYGLHLNAEIGFLSARSENLFQTVLEMQPRDTGKGTGTSMSREDKVKTMVDEIMDKAPDEFNMLELMARVEDKTPYVLVAFQELERMNILFREIKRSLKELDLGLRGELTISMDMETLMEKLFLEQVPVTWSKLAYPSLLPLGAWLADLVARLRELDNWSTDFTLPPSVWLAGFFNPQSFLTAIMQSTARKNEWPLDKMCLHCEVTKKSREEILVAPREGASVHGLFMEGARWDIQVGGIVESRVKELFPTMPVIFIKAITQDKADVRGVYECPLYKTRQRGPTYVWTFNLKTKEKPGKWTLAGVALLLSV